MSIRNAFKDLLSRLSPWAGVRLRTEPIPESWPAIVAHCVPLAARLAEEERERLYRLIQVFLDEVPIEGVAGLEITEEIRVTIAAQACLLLLHMSYPRYTRVRRVLVYPWTFVPRTAPSLASGRWQRAGRIIQRAIAFFSATPGI